MQAIKDETEKLTAQFFLPYRSDAMPLISFANQFIQRDKTKIRRGELLKAQLKDLLMKNIGAFIDISPLIPTVMRKNFEKDLNQSVTRALTVVYNTLDRILIMGKTH